MFWGPSGVFCVFVLAGPWSSLRCHLFVFAFLLRLRFSGLAPPRSPAPWVAPSVAAGLVGCRAQVVALARTNAVLGALLSKVVTAPVRRGWFTSNPGPPLPIWFIAGILQGPIPRRARVVPFRTVVVAARSHSAHLAASPPLGGPKDCAQKQSLVPRGS